MAASNKAIKMLIHAVENIEDQHIRGIESWLSKKRSYAEMWGDMKPITDE